VALAVEQAGVESRVFGAGKLCPLVRKHRAVRSVVDGRGKGVGGQGKEEVWGNGM
jgi:hypothetical protein